MHAFFIIILIEIIIIVFCKIGHIHKCSCYIIAIYHFLKIIFFIFFFLHETDFCVFANSLFYPFKNVNQKYACKMLLP